MKFLWLLFILIPMTVFGAAGCDRVPAGNVGVKVYLLGGDKGVDTEELSPGRYWIGWNEELHIFPTFTQNNVWTANEKEGSPNDDSISFQTKEGLAVSADVGISYHIQPDKVSSIFQKYRRGVDEITDIYLRNMVRDALVNQASVLPIESVYGSGKTDLIKGVENSVRSQVGDIGIQVERIYWIGQIRLPDSVVSALNDKIKATQRAQQRNNEIAEAKADAQIIIETAKGSAGSIIVNAEAQAEANKIIAESLTDSLVAYKAIEKWSGALPRFTGGGALPFLNVTPELTKEKDE